MSNYTYIEASTQIKNGAGKLKGIFVSAASSTPTITIYDDINGGTSKVVIATFTPVAATNYPLGMGGESGLYTNTGINVVISGTVKATVVYE